MKWIKATLIVLISIIALFTFCTKKLDTDAMVHQLFEQKKDITILVTDSGLGGLSVAADVAARLPQSGVFEDVRIVFFNSLFHNKSGYNSLDTEAEKVRIFNIALEAMKEKYRPDLLLIACNTLSVLYDKTPFACKADFPVIGIVKTGVDLIDQQFKKSPASKVIIFATKTTIGSNTHKNMLIERGYPEEQIIGQACHRLAGSIERGTDSEKTIGLITKYVNAALKKVEPGTSIFASLNCTHYGYSMDQFKKIFADAGYPDITIIDPNPRMADFLFSPEFLHRYDKTNVSVEVVSRVSISQKKRDSLDGLLRGVSPVTADALQNYQYDPDLFDAQFDTTHIGKK